ncbi:MAG: hypothetical protein ABIJ83_02780, partial [Patescibacteria group bacterium]
MFKKQFKTKFLIPVFLFLVSCILFLAPAFAADNNENQYMCVNYIWNCDSNYSGCTVNAGYDWTSNGYPSGAGNPQCCGDDSNEKYIECEDWDGTDCGQWTGKILNACCDNSSDCVYNGICYNLNS